MNTSRFPPLFSLRNLYHFQSPQVTFVLGLRIYIGPYDALTEFLYSQIVNGSTCLVSCMNPHSFVLSRLYPDFRFALSQSTACICDGIGFFYAVKLRLAFLPSRLQRITGRQLLASSILVARKLSLTPICIVPSESTALVAKSYFRKMLGVEPICLVPPFLPRIHPAWFFDSLPAEAPSESLAVFLFIGAPKQELLAADLLRGLPNSLLVPVGGVIDEICVDHVDDTFSRIKLLSSKYGFEWFVRFLKEPSRMYKRLFVSTIIYFVLLCSSFISLPIKKILRWFFV